MPHCVCSAAVVANGAAMNYEDNFGYYDLDADPDEPAFFAFVKKARASRPIACAVAKPSASYPVARSARAAARRWNMEQAMNTPVRPNGLPLVVTRWAGLKPSLDASGASFARDDWPEKTEDWPGKTLRSAQTHLSRFPEG